jgi:peptidoglycan/LPS O-acetylase OafA/YrhL
MWFQNTVIPRLTAYMPHTIAVFVSGCIAFCLTLTLSVLSYRFLEGPIVNFKKRLKYGPVRKPRVTTDQDVEVFAEVG